MNILDEYITSETHTDILKMESVALKLKQVIEKYQNVYKPGHVEAKETLEYVMNYLKRAQNTIMTDQEINRRLSEKCDTLQDENKKLQGALDQAEINHKQLLELWQSNSK